MKRWGWLAVGAVAGAFAAGMVLPAAFASSQSPYSFMSQMMQRASTTPQGQVMIQQCAGYMNAFADRQSSK